MAADILLPFFRAKDSSEQPDAAPLLAGAQRGAAARPADRSVLLGDNGALSKHKEAPKIMRKVILKKYLKRDCSRVNGKNQYQIEIWTPIYPIFYHEKFVKQQF